MQELSELKVDISVSMDPDTGLILIDIDGTLEALGIPEVNADGHYVLASSTSLYGEIVFTAESATAPNEAIFSVEFSDLANVDARQWRTNVDDARLAAQRCVCQSMTQGIVKAICKPDWCTRQTVVCQRAGDVPTAWCEWQ